MHRQSFNEDYEFTVVKTEDGGYSVNLPHQCSEWEIIGAEIDEDKENEQFTNGYPNLPKNKEFAIKQMELFIKRATEALEKLKTL